MSTVTKVSEWQNPNKNKPQWFVDLDDDGERVESVCFSPQAADLRTGEPLPAGWLLQAPKEEGWKPMLKAPAPQGGGGGKREYIPAFHQTAEGVAYEQERMDRRTALMQAVALDSGIVTELAEKFYKWLRESVSAPRAAAGGERGQDSAAMGKHGAASYSMDGVPQREGEFGNREIPPRVGADTPVDGGGASAAGELAPREAGVATGRPPPSTPSHTEKWTPEAGCPTCHQAWGPNTTATGKRVCVGGHVERIG